MSNPENDVALISGWFKVLSDPTRLQLFHLLLKGVQCNCELGEMMGISNNLTSHHLRVLAESGLVDSNRSEADARWVFYSVNQERLMRVRQSIDPFLRMDESPERQPNCIPRVVGKKPRRKVAADE